MQNLEENVTDEDIEDMIKEADSINLNQCS
jgi:hypothetical protein